MKRLALIALALCASALQAATLDTRVFAPYLKSAAPNRTNTVGDSVTLRCDAYIAASTSQGSTVNSPTYAASTMPPGCTLTSATTGTYSCTLTTASASFAASCVGNNATGPQIASNFTWTINAGSGINPATDWAQRSAGAIFAENWANYSTTAQMKSTATNPSFFAASGPAANITLDATHALSGKGMRINRQPGDGENNGTYIMYLNGANATPRDTFYLQGVVWGDEFFDYNYQNGPDGDLATNKIFILDRPYCSDGTGRIVMTNNYSDGFITTYQSQGDPHWKYSVSTPSGNANRYQGEIDNGGSSGTIAQWKQRFGPIDRFFTGTATPGVKLSTQGRPDPDMSIGGVAFQRGYWTVFEGFMDRAANTWKLWGSRYGEAPKLLIDSRTTGVNQTDIVNRQECNTAGCCGSNGTVSGYSGVMLTTFSTNGITSPTVPNLFLDYVEWIVDDAPIPFPGGHALPGFSAMETLAQTMPLTSWATLSTTGAATVFAHPGGGDESIMEFAANAAWDPTNKRFHFVGSNDGSVNFGEDVYYTASTNTWTKNSRPSFMPAGGAASPSHAYDGNTFDTSRGWQYYLKFSSKELWRKTTLPGGAWSSVSDLDSNGEFWQDTGVIAYFPARDVLVTFQEVEAGGTRVVELNPTTYAQTVRAQVGSQNGLHSYIACSTLKSVCVMGGGDNSGTRHRFSSVAALSSMSSNGLSLTSSTGGGKIFEDPVSGNFITLHSNGSTWEYNPTTDVWTNLNRPHGFTNMVNVTCSTTNLGVGMCVQGGNASQIVKLFKR